MNVATILKEKGRAVATLRPDATLLEVSEKLSTKRIGAIVIVGDAGRVAGIISERDVIRAIAKSGCEVLKCPVADFMTRDIECCQESDPIDEVMEAMTKGRFRHQPVIEDGALVGIISIGDVVKNHVAEVEMEVSAMRSYLATG
ncbi:MAG: CBS domain-containing protein [Alphaproteobacteria bacterium]|nr:CBS domain-containing protein [Alphaproteobacteria bacterium]